LEPVEFSCELVDFLDQFGLDDDGHAKFFIDLLQQLAPQLELLYSPGVESKMFASVQDLLEDEVICWVNRVRGHWTRLSLVSRTCGSVGGSPAVIVAPL